MRKGMSFILIPNWKMVPKDGIKGSTIIVLWFQVPFVEINFVSLFFLFFGGGGVVSKIYYWSCNSFQIKSYVSFKSIIKLEMSRNPFGFVIFELLHQVFCQLSYVTYTWYLNSSYLFFE